MDIKFPAEWEPQQAVMLAWPHDHTDWDYILDETIACYQKIASLILRQEDLIVVTPFPELAQRDLAHVEACHAIHYFKVPTNDTWARDFGAITVYHDQEPVPIDFKFNAWGLKFPAFKDNLITQELSSCGLFRNKPVNCQGFVLEGGSVESDGYGTLMTTSQCLLSPNRNGHLTQVEIEAFLCGTLGVKKVLWLHHGEMPGDDTDAHIDTMARFAPGNVILYNGNSSTPGHVNPSLEMMRDQLRQFTNADGGRYHLMELPVPHPITDENGCQLPATYANFLIMNRQVLVPVYNQPDLDERAIKIIQRAFPAHEVCGVDCTSLIKQHGSLHCITMQFPSNTLNL